MTEYRIVTKLDPSGVSAGKAKVKQDLREIDSASTATKRALTQAFSSGAIDRSVNALLARIDILGGKMDEVARSSAAVASSNATTAASLDRLANSGAKAGDGLGRAGKGGQDGARGAAAMEAATRRVLQAVDQEAAELMRLNSLLAEAKVLHEKGVITSGQYARVQTMVTNGIKTQLPSLQQQRAGFMMAGQQVQDWTQQLALGINPLVVLAQQGGQTASAMEMALGRGGTAGKVASFIAGPYGSLILAGVAVIGMMIYKHIELGNALDKEVEKLKKDAKETETTRQAKLVFANTLDGVTDALNRNREALKQLDDQEKTAARRALESAIASQIRLKGIRAETAALIEQADAELTLAKNRVPLDESATAYQQGLGIIEDRIATLRANLTKTDADIAEADKQVNEATGRRYVEIAQLSPEDRIKRRYDLLIEAAYRRATAEGKVTTELVRQVKVLSDQSDAEVKAYEKSHRDRKPPGDGVSRFRSREQAVGVAGRELQGAGLRVSENVQFGGVHSSHPGMGNVAHGKFAIDVNSGSGVVEANVPDLRDRFDEMARRYQARGYRVLWNGKVYEANGAGPSGPIRHGDQHHDHMHLEAPSSIVGKPTQASGEQQAIQDWRKEQTAAQQQSDFVQGVVDQAATQGMGNRAESLNARIDKTLADFKRRFDREAGPDEAKRMTDALTEADARETATRFDEAYVQPLKRLQDLQGKTGIDRAILNAQLEESERLGRKLTPIEEARIANSIRQSDALTNEAEILASILQPVQDYSDRIAALNALLEKGAINQTTYNARIAEMGQSASQAIADMPGVDPGTGERYADVAASAEEKLRYAQELDLFQTQKERLLQMGVDYNALIEAAQRRHVENMNNIDQARKTAALNTASQLFGMLAGLQNSKSKEIQAIGKAAAITQATIDAFLAINKTLADPTIPSTPMRIAMAVAIGAVAFANVASIVGLKDGGYISGAGGPRDDRIPVSASNGEFMVNADAVAQPGNRALLEAMNNGNLTAHMRRRAQNDNGATSAGGGGDSYQLSFGDVVVHTNAGANNPREIGREVKAAISTIVRDEIAEARRDGGALTRPKSSVLAGG